MIKIREQNKHDFMETIYGVIWLTVAALAVVCALTFGIPDAFANSCYNLVECPTYLDNNATEKEQYLPSEASNVFLSQRTTPMRFENGAVRESVTEYYVGESDDFHLSTDLALEPDTTSSDELLD